MWRTLAIALASGVLVLSGSPTAAATSPWSGAISVGNAIVQTSHSDYWDDGHPTIRAGAHYRLWGPLEVGVELGYIDLGRPLGACVPEGPCPERDRSNIFEAVPSVRLRPKFGRIRPYVAAGAGPYAIRSRAQLGTDREVSTGITGAIGIHGIVPYGIGLEARWHTIFSGSRAYDETADILSFLIGLNLN